MNTMLTRSVLLGIAVVWTLGVAVAPTHARGRSTKRSDPTPRDVRERTLVSSSTGDGLSKAVTDTFYLYGGPGTNEGKFENGSVPDRQGWIGVDLTDKPVYWQASTFNAENLGAHGVGNHAAWSGQSEAHQPGWSSAPGYGNDWSDRLVFRSGPLADPLAPQTVNLDFFFNYDTEPGYDFFQVEYDSAGTWVSVLRLSGTSRDSLDGFSAPGLRYSEQPARPITFVGGDCGGPNGDEILIRIRVSSDPSGSDEDGLWPTVGGAAQVDDISVTWSDGTDLETFESIDFDGLWRPEIPPFAGDFSKVWPGLATEDLIPCAENSTPLMQFIDAGQEVGNAASAARIPNYPTSTGGKESSNISAYFSIGYVVNYDGGLSEFLGPSNQVSLHNEVWSPEIQWDVPGAGDDGIDVSGAKLRFSVWTWLPLSNGIFYVWHLRSSVDGVSWGGWKDRNFVYYGGGRVNWLSCEEDLAGLLPPNPQKLQIALGVLDYADVFGFPGTDATPAPAFDNVALLKYRIGGPVISVDESHLANDGFPVSGSIDVSSPSARDALDIPFDMAKDISEGHIQSLTAGDSIVADVVARIPGTAVSDVRMVWVLDRNPLFEDAIRSVPSRLEDRNVVTGPAQWSGEVLGDSATTSTGNVVPNRFFFDLPDQDLIYPGDVLRYYIRATDSDGRVTTLPENTTGFVNGVGYDPVFTMSGLPSVVDATGTQSRILVLDEIGDSGGEAAVAIAFGELGLREGQDYDTYTTSSPSSGLSNGIGSAGSHGASANQLAGYDAIVYFSGTRTSFLLSDGSGVGNNDKSNDLGVLTAWHALPGDRSAAYFGDSIASRLVWGHLASQTYLHTIMGVDVNDADVRDEVGGQLSPRVGALNGNFVADFVADGGCPGINQFDSVRARPGASRGHAFADPFGVPIPDVAASVIHDRIEGGDRKIDVSFPMGFSSITSPMLKAAGNRTARTELLSELLWFMQVGSVVEGPTATPEAKIVSMSVSPNPFNPRTVVRFTGLAANASGSVRVYNTRGELVVVLHDGPFAQSEFVWDGTDGNGRAVASGVYMIEGRADEFRRVEKVAVLK